MGMNPRLMRPVASGVHPEALAWKTAAVANGGQVSSTQLRAVSDLCKLVDANGLRDRFVRLNLCCGDNVAAAVVPLYRGPSRSGTQYGNTVDTNVGPFADGALSGYTATGGLKGDGATRRLDIGITIGACVNAGMDYAACHLSYWWLSGGSYSGAITLGGSDYQNCAYGAGLYGYSDLAQDVVSTSGDETTGGIYSAATCLSMSGAAYGLHVGTRWSSGAAYSISGTDVTGGCSQDSGSPWQSDDTANSFSVMAISDLWDIPTEACNGTHYLYADGNLGMYSFGREMASSSMRAAWYTIMLAFQQAIGRA